MQRAPTIVVSDTDLFRIQACLGKASTSAGASAAALEACLSRAHVVPTGKVPPHVVTMNSRLRLVDVDTGRQREVTLVYPRDADKKGERLSVLEPTGAALLGLTVGGEVRLPTPSGRRARLRLMELLYQPESAGDYHR